MKKNMRKSETTITLAVTMVMLIAGMAQMARAFNYTQDAENDLKHPLFPTQAMNFRLIGMTEKRDWVSPTLLWIDMETGVEYISIADTILPRRDAEGRIYVASDVVAKITEFDKKWRNIVKAWE